LPVHLKETARKELFGGRPENVIGITRMIDVHSQRRWAKNIKPKDVFERTA